MEGTDHGSVQGPFSVPVNFIPLATDDCTTSVINLRSYTHQQLTQLAAQRNHESGMTEDPFGAVLRGIPERSRLRPGSKEPESFYMGLQGLRPHSKYALAWRRLLRSTQQLDAEPIKSAKGAAAAADPARVTGKNDKSKAHQSQQWTWQQLQPCVPPDQQRWRDRLAAFLCRPVHVPLLAPWAPVLDMQKLFAEVMAQGGYRSVTAAGGWGLLAQYLQRDEAFAPFLQAVYECYLHPLEHDLPCAYRAAKALDHMCSRIQLRTAVGPRAATYKSVAFKAQRTAALLHTLQLWQSGQHVGSHATSGLKSCTSQQQQQQQQAADCSIAVTCPVAGTHQLGGGASVSHCCLGLLREAAVDPVLMVHVLRQHGIQTGMHKTSKQACQQDYRGRLLRINKRFAVDHLDQVRAAGDRALFHLDTDLEEEGIDEGPAEGPAEHDDDSTTPSAGTPTHPAASATAAATAGDVLAAAVNPGADSVAVVGDVVAAAAAADITSADSQGAPGGAGGGVQDLHSGQQRAQQAAGAAASPAQDVVPPFYERAAGEAACKTSPGSSAATPMALPTDPTQSVAEMAAQQGILQKQQQWQEDPVLLDAARWLLLSRHTALSGPPGCRQGLLFLAGMPDSRQGDPHRRRSSVQEEGAKARNVPHGARLGGRTAVAPGAGSTERPKQRTYLGRTPRCGNCKTCLNRQLKKACLVNRAKMGLSSLTGSKFAAKGVSKPPLQHRKGEGIRDKKQHHGKKAS